MNIIESQGGDYFLISMMRMGTFLIDGTIADSVGGVMKPVLIDRAQAGLGVFTSSDSGRYALNYIHVTKDRVESSNGHVLARLSYSGLNVDEYPRVEGQATKGAEEMFILPDSLNKAMKSASKKSTMRIIEVVHAGVNEAGQSVLTATDLDSPTVIKNQTPDVQFPNVERVIPTDLKPTIRFSAKYLGQIAKWAVAHGGPSATICFCIKDKDSAARLEVNIGDDRKALFILMPVRMDD